MGETLSSDSSPSSRNRPKVLNTQRHPFSPVLFPLSRLRNLLGLDGAIEAAHGRRGGCVADFHESVGELITPRVFQFTRLVEIWNARARAVDRALTLFWTRLIPAGRNQGKKLPLAERNTILSICRACPALVSFATFRAMPSRDIEGFISHWSAASPSERANSQAFLLELCDLLAVPRPDNHPNAGYFFEFPVTEQHADGTTTGGRIDLYKRACFVLESKQFQAVKAEASQLELAAEEAGVIEVKKFSQPVRGTNAWDDAMIKARGQAERYVRALSGDNPPFLIVVDVGHSFEIFADFTQAGKAYLPFPDPRTFRVRLADLADEKIRERLGLIWTTPGALDPAKRSADVTREISGHLAELAKSLEKSKHKPEVVAQFLTRCLFCMFAEDVGLLPERSFTDLLDSLPTDGTGFQSLVQTLFREMNAGTGNDISVILRKKLLKFNGGLFADDTLLPINGLQLGLLKNAARQNWRNVEPAIFGTLLERALNPGERHKLGAHFTPREYVERLVLPTVIEPLRAEWENVRAAAITHARAGDLKKARAAVVAFHDHLCRVIVLDPACGTGNFLYVSLQQLKVLEGEVLDVAAQFGENFKLELGEKHSVDPHQFLGLEINPRAAAIAELVLWIGYLQWHFRLHGKRTPPEPILRAFKNIQCRDAVLEYDGEPQPVTWKMALENPDLPGRPDSMHELLRSGASADRRQLTGGENNAALCRDAATPDDETITVWDRRSMKRDLVTGRDVPDETKRVPLLTYANPRPAAWPPADFIVGNPPFIGKGKLREDLGDGYAETLRAAYPDVPESADFVLYWWHKAAELVRTGKARRFGLITTNSLRQTFARRVVQFHLSPRAEGQARPHPGPLPRGEGDSVAALRPTGRARTNSARGTFPPLLGERAGVAVVPTKPVPLSLIFAIPDHPWVDTAEGAAVRIAMTVGVPGEHSGELLLVNTETEQADGSANITFDTRRGKISADLTTGANLSATVPLKSNVGMTSMGVMLAGRGFIVEESEALALGASKDHSLDAVLRPIRNGKDLLDEARRMFVIDFTGLSADESRNKYPSLFQILLTRVKPEREQNRDQQFRDKWWLFGRSRPEVRAMTVGLRRYIATVETAKHRLFEFLSSDILPEHRLIAFGTDDAFFLGVLSSRIHVAFALAAGGTLEDRPVYNKSRCFDPFPFPLCGEKEKARIRELAEALDAHRKQVQAKHGVTLTGLYNVLEKLRAAEVGTSRCDVPARASQSSAGGSEISLAENGEAPAGSAQRANSTRLTEKEKFIHDRGLVSTLKSLHDDLAAAVSAAYGWPASLTDAEILERLVALNADREAEEARGVIHWLRPEYQAKGKQTDFALPEIKAAKKEKAKSTKPKGKIVWPKTLAERVQAVEAALHTIGTATTPDAIAEQFKRAKPADVAEILETLVTLGRARQIKEKFTR